MMAKKLYFFGVLIMVCHVTSAQSILVGKVTESGSKEPLPFVNVALFRNGVLKAGAMTDFDGLYRITEIDAGTYDIEFSLIGYEKLRHFQIQLFDNQVISYDVELKINSNIIFCISGGKVPIVQMDQTNCGREFVSKTKTEVDFMVAELNYQRCSLSCYLFTEVTVDKPITSMRGSRPETTIFFGDGVRPSNVKSELENAIPAARKDSVMRTEMLLAV
jgi:hypothetical protein